MSFFNFLYFRAHNSNPSRHELCARKFKKLNNAIFFYILPYVKPTLHTYSKRRLIPPGKQHCDLIMSLHRAAAGGGFRSEFYSP